jgi:hypothetical protein
MLKSQLRTVLATLLTALLFAACSSVKPPDDRAITTDIQSKLFADPVLKTRDIHVSSQQGVVTLAGTVNTELEKGAIERLAQDVNGVKSVNDQLTIAQAVAPPDQTAQAQAANTEPPPAPRRRQRASRARSSAPQETADTAPAAAAAPAPVAQAPAPAPAPATPPPPQPQHYTVPAGSVVTVRMIDGIDSSRNRPGEEFAATVDSPIVVGDRVVIPKNCDARVRLVQAKSAGRMTGRSELELELVSIAAGGQTYQVESGAYQAQGASRGKRTAETVGGGAVLGGLIGALAGRGKGAAIGAAIGAGAGTGVQAATKGQAVKVPSETKIDFTLKSPLTVTLE